MHLNLLQRQIVVVVYLKKNTLKNTRSAFVQTVDSGHPW